VGQSGKTRREDKCCEILKPVYFRNMVEYIRPVQVKSIGNFYKFSGNSKFIACQPSTTILVPAVSPIGVLRIHGVHYILISLDISTSGGFVGKRVWKVVTDVNEKQLESFRIHDAVDSRGEMLVDFGVSDAE